MKRKGIGRRSVVAGVGSLIVAPAIVRAEGQNGVALVIGNSKYHWEAQLPNVRRDAPDVAKRFQALGLRTELVLDADRKTMLAALEKFKAGVSGAALAAIYFAGHGVTWEKDDFVVPVDADLNDPSAVKSLVRSRLFGDTVAAAAHRLLVFDNCRNNPADGWRQTAAERRAAFSAGSGSSGPANPNYLLLSSTAPGHIALDGPAGQNSPFAASLMRLLDEPSVDLQSLPERLRRDLLIATEGRQLLFSRSSFNAPFTLNRSGAASAIPAPAVASSRIVELTRAYAFANEHKYPIPPGLVAIRPAAASAQSSKVGSFSAMTRNKYGKYPCLFIVLSVERGDKVDVLWSGMGFNGAPAWRYYAGGLEGNRIKLFSATGGQDSDELFLDWQSPTSAVMSMQGSGVGGAGGGVFTAKMERLDG